MSFRPEEIAAYIREHYPNDSVSTIGQSITVRPGLDPSDIESIDGSEKHGCVLSHRPDHSDDNRTWFDLDG